MSRSVGLSDPGGNGGQGWIRTSEGVSQWIYSPPRLATPEPTQKLRGLLLYPRFRAVQAILRSGPGLAARLDFDGFDRDVLERIVVRVGGLRTDFVEHVHALDDVREDGVFSIEFRHRF